MSREAVATLFDLGLVPRIIGAESYGEIYLELRRRCETARAAAPPKIRAAHPVDYFGLAIAAGRMAELHLEGAVSCLG